MEEAIYQILLDMAETVEDGDFSHVEEETLLDIYSKISDLLFDIEECIKIQE